MQPIGLTRLSGSDPGFRASCRVLLSPKEPKQLGLNKHRGVGPVVGRGHDEFQKMTDNQDMLFAARLLDMACRCA